MPSTLRSVASHCLVALILASSALISGCGSPPNQSLVSNFWSPTHSSVVVVALEKPPQAELDHKGPQALWGVVGSRLTSLDFALYLRQYKVPDLQDAQSTFVRSLQQRHIPVQAYNTPLPRNFKQYSSILLQPANQTLLVLKIKKLGAERKYVGVIPTGAPKAFCIAEGQLIRLTDNKVLWYFSTKQSVDAPDSWDQPPQYPLFTQALDRAIHQSMNGLLQNFMAQAPR